MAKKEKRKRDPAIQFEFTSPLVYPNFRYVSQDEIPRKRGHFLWQATESYTLAYIHKDVECSITIPRLFLIDGASIPRIAWSLIGLTPGGASLLFAGGHDPLYRTAGLTKFHGQEGVAPIEATGKLTFDRWECDLFMRDLIVWCREFNKVQCRVAFRIVHTFGKKHFGGPAPSFG